MVLFLIDPHCLVRRLDENTTDLLSPYGYGVVWLVGSIKLYFSFVKEPH